MQLQGFIDWAVCSLRDLYPEHEARNMVDILLEERTGRKSWFAVAHPDFELCAAELAGLKDDVARLCTGEPLQYVLGFAWFYSRRFRVSPAVLIPRPETEILVDTVLSRLSDSAHVSPGTAGAASCLGSGSSLRGSGACCQSSGKGVATRILDLCTGSGCIAWTLALECPNASVTALDISRDALALARTQFPPAPAATVASPAAAPLATSADAVPHSSFAGCVSGASPSAAPLATSAGASTAFPAVASGTSPAASPVASPASSPAASPAASPASSPASSPAAFLVASPAAFPVASPAAFPVASPSGAVSEGDRVVFVEADVLDLSEKGISGDCSEMGLGKFDVIVSNPPYVMDKEKSQMRTNVLDYEPSIALFVPDDDPLIFYRAIAHHASRLLTDRGWGIVEINSLLANQTADCFRTAGFPTVSVLSDLSGRPRFVHFSRI